LTETYVAKSLQGRIVAFTRCTDEVCIYLPDDMYEKIGSITHEQWAEQKQSYINRDDGNLDLYDDTVNAAWQRLSINTIDRASARKIKLLLGEYFPRIWRGVYDVHNHYYYNSINARKMYGGSFIGSNVAASNIFDAVESLFRFVEPTKENLSAYGHKIREALILTCTEVESAWKVCVGGEQR
jgi:hypothetical protein